MSWTGYVDSIIANGKGCIQKASLIGLNGALWTPASAATPNVLNVNQTEATQIAGTMSNKGSAGATLAQSGATVDGIRYMFLRDIDGDGKMMTLKKQGVGQLVLRSTNQAVIIAFIPEAQSHSAGNANTAVENIAKYLEESGY